MAGITVQYSIGEDTFFIYDTSINKKEEDDPRNAIVFFYPSNISDDEQCMLCGQVVGAISFIGTISASPPTLVKMKHVKFTVYYEGVYIIALAGSLKLQKNILRNRLAALYRLFVLFHQSISKVHEVSLKRDLFLYNMRNIWTCYIRFIHRHRNSVKSIFETIPVLNIPKNLGSLFLKASHILQNCCHHDGVMSGCILYKNSVLCNELPVNLVERFMIQAHNRGHLPFLAADTEFALPKGISVFPIYLTPEEFQLTASSKLEVKDNIQPPKCDNMKNQPRPNNNNVLLEKILHTSQDESKQDSFEIREHSDDVKNGYDDRKANSDILKVKGCPTENENDISNNPLSCSRSTVSCSNNGVNQNNLVTISKENKVTHNENDNSSNDLPMGTTTLNYDQENISLHNEKEHVLPCYTKNDPSSSVDCERFILPTSKNMQKKTTSSSKMECEELLVSDQSSLSDDVSRPSKSTQEKHAPALKKCSLYLQAHSEIVLLLVMNVKLGENSQTVNKLWKMALPLIGDLELELNRLPDTPTTTTDETKKYRYVHYNKNRKILRGFNHDNNIQTTSLLFHSPIQMISTEFMENTLVTDLTLRTCETVIYGHRNANILTFFTPTTITWPIKGIPSPRDADFCLEQRAKRKLAQENINLV